MSHRSLITICTAAGLFGLYVVYALAMNAVVGVQVLETRKGVRLPPPQPPVEATQMAQDYLGDDAPWAAEAQYRVRSHGSFIYYQKWEQEEQADDEPDDSVRFSPFAVIWTRDEDRPYSIVSRSARIQFANEFSLTSPDTGRPIGGAMIGDVKIQGPNGLVVTGQNFFYSEEAMKIWSDYPVEFQIGKHRGSAGSIQIDVTIDRAAITREEFAISGIRNITLRHKIRLNLAPDEEHPDMGEVQIACERTLDFDTEVNTATFEKNVVVTRPTTGKDYDRLTCDKLKLVFEPATPHMTAKLEEGELPVEHDEPVFSGLDSNLVFNRLQALGPGVVLVSTQNKLRAEMQQLIYSASDRLTILRDPRQVNVQHGTTEILSPEISIKQDERNEIQALQCDGSGELRAYEKETGEPQMQAQWGRRLRVTPDPETSTFLIELERHAVVNQPKEELSLSADYIRLWVLQNQQPDGSSESPSAALSAGSGWQGNDVVPERMLAVENVGFRSPELRGTTRRLEVWFAEPASLPQIKPELTGRTNLRQPARISPIRTASDSRVQFSVNDSTAPPTIKPATAAFLARERQAPGFAQVDGLPNKKPRVLQVSSDLIQVEVIRSTELAKSWVRQVVTRGNVQMQQEASASESSLRIEGDTLQVENPDTTNENQIIHVFGKPARIRNGNMSLAGNQLHLDRHANKAWVTGPGVMQQLVDSNLDDLELEQPEMMNVWWKEGMTFDGIKANFYEDVRVQLGHTSLVSQELEVLLSRKVDFQNDADRKRIDINELTCKYAVQFESKKFENNQIREFRQGEFNELDYHRETNKTTIKGPGTLFLWRVGNSNRSGLASGKVATVNRPLHTREGQWEYLQVDFSGNVDGNLNSRITSFRDKVHVIFGPVNALPDKLNIDHLPVEGGWMRSDSLDITIHPETENLELIASGNVELEGRGSDDRSFFARADTLTYDESKKMYRLRSLEQRLVSIWIDNPTVRQDANRVVAKVAEFFPETFQLKLDGVMSFEGVE